MKVGDTKLSNTNGITQLDVHEEKVDAKGKANGSGDTTDRAEWNSTIEYILSILGTVMGYGNIWRFPAIAYENGGSAFLLVYAILTMLFALPIIYAELVMGQYSRSGLSVIFKMYFPAMQGLGWAMALLTVSITIYYILVVSWAAIYMVSVLFGQSSHWVTCDNWWNTIYCSEDNRNAACAKTNPKLPIFFNGTCIATASPKMLSASEEFFTYFVIEPTNGIDEIGWINWKVALSFTIMWICVALILYKGIDSFGKVSLVTATLPHIILIALFIRAITLPGSGTGISYFIGRLNFDYVFRLRTWVTALKQLCFSLFIGYGGLITLASYSKFHNNCFRDAVILVSTDTIMSIFGGITVFGTLGYLSHEVHLPVDKVVQSGTALAFVTYPKAMSIMPLPWLWSFLFFALLFILGTSSQAGMVEVFCTTLYDQWPSTRNHKTIVSAATCFVMFLIGFIMCCGCGFYWFNVYDEFTGSTAIFLTIALECIILSYFYGRRNVMKDVEEMRGPAKKGMMKWIGEHSPYYPFNWLWITPPIALAIMIFTLIRDRMTLRIKGEVYTFPLWAEVGNYFNLKLFRRMEIENGVYT
ncbi:hypothetical protein WR25_18411 isoform B [Diploscapter pachys]|uniref:Transporter n=3 Tax=Diploscapter pachys TaxID=2018661 RepID=A0A2A2LMH5_9BILA|nr:hypothetical protein WR25_18411 isoform B [Diploscapter pachys]